MEALNALQHIHSHFVNWRMQQRTSGRIVFWVREGLEECIKGDWRVPARLVKELIEILVHQKISDAAHMLKHSAVNSGSDYAYLCTSVIV